MAGTVLLDAQTTNATSGVAYWDGKAAVWSVWGTFDSATVALQFSPDGGTSWLEVASLAAPGFVSVSVPNAQIRVVVSGGGVSLSISSNMMKAEAVGAGAATGGGAGDASAAKQDEQTDLLTDISTRLGDPGATDPVDPDELADVSQRLAQISRDIQDMRDNLDDQAEATDPVPTTDRGPGWTTVFGVSGAVVTSADAQTPVAVTAAPTAGEKLVITDIIASSEVEQWLEFEIETAGTVFLKVFLPANGTVQITPRSKLKLPTADKKLMVDAEAAGNIAVTAFYYSEP